MDKDKVLQTKFGKQVTEDSVDIAKLAIAQDKKKKKLVPTSEQSYILRVSDVIVEINNLLDNLEYCEIFLNSYSASAAWKKKYDWSHYIRYHYEVWIMNLVRLYERILILVNEVYDLGVEDKQVNYRTISSNRHLENTGTLKLLKKIDDALNNIRAARNQVLHRSMYDDDKLKRVAMFDFVARHGNNQKERGSFIFAAKLDAKIYLMTKKKEVKENNIKMVDIVEAIYKTLDIKYDEMKRHLVA